jgi:hypothetical protein
MSSIMYDLTFSEQWLQKVLPSGMYDVYSIESQLTFQSNMLPTSSCPSIRQARNKRDAGSNQSSASCWFLKMEATCSSEMSVDFQWTIWRDIPEGSTMSLILVHKTWILLMCNMFCMSS